jgi:trehalose 6-phosphate phosphatase
MAQQPMGPQSVNTALPPPPLPCRAAALFLDFDGTLVELANRPEAVAVDRPILDVLRRLTACSEGAVAIITGRDIETIDRFIAPLRLPVAGAHGHVRRTAGGNTIETSVDQDALSGIADSLTRFAAGTPGLLVERKSRSVALHYRLAPERAAAGRAAVERAIADTPQFTLLQGKFVYEVRSTIADKGHAIAAFMAEAPFAGRLPVFAGDDVTDEEGFALVNRTGGLSIKVGAGSSTAAYRLRDPSDLRNWLDAMARQASEDGCR